MVCLRFSRSSHDFPLNALSHRELAELLGQVKPPVATQEDIEKSGLQIILANELGEYERQGKVASNCVERVRPSHIGFVSILLNGHLSA